MANEEGLIQLRNDVDLAGHLAIRARVFLDIWWLYAGAPTRSKYLATMNEYSEFYRLEPHAHEVSMVMYLSQLFETRNDTLNLPSLVKAGMAADLQKDVIDNCLSRLEAVRPLIPKMMILRSNLFAHRSASLSYSKVFELAALKPDQLRTLSDASIAVVNTLGSALGVGEKFVHMLAPRHAEQVLKDLGALRGHT